MALSNEINFLLNVQEKFIRDKYFLDHLIVLLAYYQFFEFFLLITMILPLDFYDLFVSAVQTNQIYHQADLLSQILLS